MMLDGGAVEGVLYLADSYKITHHSQYPAGTSYVYSYFECRGGKFPEYIIKRWLSGQVVTKEQVLEAKEFYKEHFGSDYFNEEGWMYIVEKHGGRLPLRICAVPEGSVVPVKNVLFTVENTDPAVPWLTNWFETLLVQAWYPITVCTNSRAQKEIIARYLIETSDSLEGLPFKLHDFGYRGSTAVESASIGGAAHMVNFQGTDTIAGLRMLKKYYDCPMAGFSVPAAEHSTITTWQKSGEADAYLHMLKQFPGGPVSVVSDSYDIYNAVANIWGKQLKNAVIERAPRGMLVIRPDSGEPVKVLNLLSENYPITINKKGYKMLPPYLRIIQGDGICYETIEELLNKLKKAGWSTDNVLFGTGAALLQKVNRDTLRCAFKCSHVVVNGEEIDVYKDPITDHAKQSKKGRLTLERNEAGEWQTFQEGRGDVGKDELIPIFENGKLLVDWTLTEIRARAELDCVRQAQSTETNGVNGSDSHPCELAAE
ncbi:unnamed protein product, partial [Mesorhabditis spiculigera]